MIYNKTILNEIKSESYVSLKVEKRKIKGRGYGLFAKEFISKDEIVSISGGIIINKSKFDELKSQGLDYAYQISDNFFICPLNPDDPSDDWRMNHCCEPNCGVIGNIMFISIRDIQKDEELTYDYCMTESDPSYKIELSCNYSTCRKRISGDDWRNPKLQDKYKEYFSSYIRNKIKH
jgi:uncharacterized protein